MFIAHSGYFLVEHTHTYFHIQFASIYFFCYKCWLVCFLFFFFLFLAGWVLWIVLHMCMYFKYAAYVFGGRRFEYFSCISRSFCGIFIVCHKLLLHCGSCPCLRLCQCLSVTSFPDYEAFMGLLYRAKRRILSASRIVQLNVLRGLNNIYSLIEGKL